MNVLLVTYSFPPAGGVGVLRALSLAKYLPESDLRVEVLTARNAAAVGQDQTLVAQVPPIVPVHRTWTLDLPFPIRKAIKRLLTRPQRTTNHESRTTKAHPLRLLLANLLLPDPQVGWLPFAFPAAKRLIRKRKIDLVLITVPPFSTLRLATSLRRKFPTLPIVLDFRDEWLTSTLYLVSFNSNPRAVRIAQQTESEAVRDATAVVCVTEAAVAELRKRYPQQPPTKFHCIPNGFDTPAITIEPQPATSNRQPATLLTYIGTVYGSTDPTPVVEAILTLPAEIRAQLRLRFIGHIETPAYRETLLSLGPQIELIGFLPQAQALAYIAQTDYLLLITHDPINVAAKLYDYLGSGKPILAAVHPTGDVRRILDQTRAGWSADIQNPTQIAQLLTEAITRTPHLAQAFEPNREAIAAYHRRAISARYAAVLKTIAEGRPQ
jgi:hypothetical protein